MWRLIIHGARGIIYFADSFGGRCESHDVLHERCGTAMRAAVAETNRRVTSLAPVLNSPFVENYVEASRSIDTMVKWFDGHFYVFVGSANDESAATFLFSLACGHAARSTVLFENRSVPVTSGRFRDTFATSNSVHIYRIVGDPSCAPAPE